MRTKIRIIKAIIIIVKEISCPSVTNRIPFDRRAKIKILGIIPKLVPIKNGINFIDEAPAAILISIKGPLGNNLTMKLL